MSFSKTVIFFVFASLYVQAAYGHEIHYETTQGDAVVLRLSSANGTVFSNERYEIFREGEDAAFQTGRSDALGRIVFLPDRAGEWRIRVFSEDGHGLNIVLETGESGELPHTNRPLWDRHDRLLIGVAFIFGFFGILSLFFRKRRK